MATRCARIIYWRAKPGMLEAYSRYLQQYVDAIDERALQQGHLLKHATWVDATPNAEWTHMRVFEFKTHAQRETMKTALVQAAAELTPDASERAQRAQLAESLRDKVREQNLDLL